MDRIRRTAAFRGEALDTKAGRRRLYGCYTGLFMILAFLVFSWYFLSGRTFVWNGDGWVQHYKALVYYARYLRSVLKELVQQHQLVIPAWDFHIGEGSDILQTFHYYVIGDPFALGSVFVPVRWMHFYYNGMILLRLYLAGLLFCVFCLETECKDSYGVLAGSAAYVFCYWALFNTARHPFFLNPMVFFPMILIGIERVAQKKKTAFLAVAVCLSAVSNFYFFYMLAVLTAVYVLVRLVVCYRGSRERRKEGRMLFMRVSAASVLGILLSAGIFLPVLGMFLRDARFSSGSEWNPLFYPLSHYSRLPALLISPGDANWMCMGYAAPVLPAVLLLFRRKNNRLLKILFVVGVAIMLFPFFGKALNGFSYVTNRWSWAFAMLCAYILAVMWKPMLELAPGRRESRLLAVCVAVYFAVCMCLEYARSVMVFTSVFFALLFLCLPSWFCEADGFWAGRRRHAAGLLLAGASIFCNSFWLNANAPGSMNYASQSWESKHLFDGLMENETAAVRDTAKAEQVDAFYRYTGRGLTLNAGVLSGPSSTQYYWSLSNPYVQKFRKELGLEREEVAVNYTGYDDRAIPAALAAVRYYVVPADDVAFLPYGYTYVTTINVKEARRKAVLECLQEELRQELTEDQVWVAQGSLRADYAVFRNEYALPLSYTYRNYISDRTWESLSAAGKQEALLHGAVLYDYDGKAGEAALPVSDFQRASAIRCNGSGVSMQEGKFVVTSAGASVTLQFEGSADSETYLIMDGLDFQSFPVYDLYFGDQKVDPLQLYNRTNWENLFAMDREKIRRDKLYFTQPQSTRLTVTASDGRQKSMVFYTKDCSVYNGQHDFSINLGYAQEAAAAVTITFADIGIYSFDSVRVECLAMNSYAQALQELKKDTMEHVRIGVDEVTGEIGLDEPGLLCLAIPYSEGWDAYVDGKKVKLYQANVMYMALDLDAGNHDIRLAYHTPWLKEGMYLSMTVWAAFLVYCGFLLFRRHKERLVKISRVCEN